MAKMEKVISLASKRKIKLAKTQVRTGQVGVDKLGKLALLVRLVKLRLVVFVFTTWQIQESILAKNARLEPFKRRPVLVFANKSDDCILETTLHIAALFSHDASYLLHPRVHPNVLELLVLISRASKRVKNLQNGHFLFITLTKLVETVGEFAMLDDQAIFFFLGDLGSPTVVTYAPQNGHRTLQFLIFARLLGSVFLDFRERGELGFRRGVLVRH